MSVEQNRRTKVILHGRLEERYLNMREVIRTLEKFLETTRTNMKTESVKERKAKKILVCAHMKLRAVMENVEKPQKLCQLAVQRVDELRMDLQELPVTLKQQV